MSNITTNTDDPAWYDEFTDPNLGLVSGLSNAGLFGSICGGLALVTVIVLLIYRHKKKKELEQIEKEKLEAERAKHGSNNKVAPVDIYEEIEGEIEQHETQKKKLSKYLQFLLNKDGEGLAEVNRRRIQAAAQRARQQKQTNPWFTG